MTSVYVLGTSWVTVTLAIVLGGLTVIGWVLAITDLFRELPELAWHVARILAARLDRASRIVHGFQEFCEQLPDAVVVTDQAGRILTWNRAAAEVYGRPAEQMLDGSIGDLYQDAATWEQLREDVRAGRVVREEVLQVEHPHRGTRSVSTSASLLYDGHHNAQGVLYLGRDVSEALRLRNRYRRVRNWTLPLLGLLTCAALAAVVGYPRLARDPAVLSVRQGGLQDQIRRDARLLASLLAAPLRADDRDQLNALLGEFLTSQASGPTPYLGLAVLDPRKQVLAAACRDPQAAHAMLGTSYAGIAFRGDEGSPHRVLSVYRPDAEHPLGAKGIEIAFPIADRDGGDGWLLFQFDVARLREDYRIDEQQLARFRL